MGKVYIKENNAEIIRQLLKTASDAALVKCGMYAESMAKTSLTASHAVDTGLLRNSVTFAVSGESAAISSYSADRGDGEGKYEGTLENESDGIKSVCVGTNVEYAPYIENGARGRGARPFIRTAISEHEAEYIQILRKDLENA